MATAAGDLSSVRVLWPLRALGLGGAGLLALAPPRLDRLRRLLDRRWGLMAVLALPAVLDLALPAVLPDLPWTNSDSWELLSFAPWRTAGYGLLLRLVAWLFPGPQAMVWLQVTGTVAAVLLFAHALRRVAGGLAAAVAGFMLLASWPLFIYAFHLLTEQPFFICILLHFAVAARTFEDPRPRRLWGLAATAMAAVAFRPAGHFLLLSLPVLLALRPDLWRRVLLHLGAPALAAVLALSMVHQSLLGYFGLSSFAGVTLSSNMLYLATADTPSADPDLMARFAAHAAAYRASLDPVADDAQRFEAVRAAAAPLTTWALATVAERLPAAGSDVVARMESALDRAGTLSPLDAVYSTVARVQRPTWPWLPALPVWQRVNADLTRAAVEVFRHDPWGTLRFTLWKLAWGWREVVPVFSMRHNLVNNECLALDRPDTGYRLRQPPSHVATVPVVWAARLHDAAAALPYGLSLLLPLPLIVLAAGVGAVAGCARALVRHRPPPAAVALAAYAAAGLALYHLELAFAQVALTRFLVAGLPMAVLLLVTPLRERTHACA